MRWRKHRPETSVDPIQLENDAAVGGDHLESVLVERALEARLQHTLSVLSENVRSAFVLVRLHSSRE